MVESALMVGSCTPDPLGVYNMPQPDSQTSTFRPVAILMARVRLNILSLRTPSLFSPALTRRPRGRPTSVRLAAATPLGLAPPAAGEVWEAIAELRDRASAVLVVEETAQQVLGMAAAVAVVARGRITWAGPAVATSAEELAALYMGKE